jgi:hypothetical protein
MVTNILGTLLVTSLSSALVMTAEACSEMLVTTRHTTRRHIPEDHSVSVYRVGNVDHVRSRFTDTFLRFVSSSSTLPLRYYNMSKIPAVSLYM